MAGLLFPPLPSPVAQLVERGTVNPLVAGSSPARGANFTIPATADYPHLLTQMGARLGISRSTVWADHFLQIWFTPERDLSDGWSP